jgi:hypothetical protein
MTNQCQNPNVKENFSFDIQSLGFYLTFWLCHLALHSSLNFTKFPVNYFISCLFDYLIFYL